MKSPDIAYSRCCFLVEGCTPDIDYAPVISLIFVFFMKIPLMITYIGYPLFFQILAYHLCPGFLVVSPLLFGHISLTHRVISSHLMCKFAEGYLLHPYGHSLMELGLLNLLDL